MSIYFIFLSGILVASSNFTGTDQLKFIEFKRYELQETLPPKILLTFDLPCNAKFVKVIRNEHVDNRSEKTYIALAGIIKESLLSSCAGETKEIHISGGSTYSGKSHEIVKIKK